VDEALNGKGDRHRRRKRRFLRFVFALPILVVATALGVWLGRDLPRIWLVSRLARTLNAEVRLARLEIDSSHHFVLHRLEVRQPSWEPRLERLVIERLEVESPIRRILRGRYDALTADGVDVLLVPPRRPARPTPKSDLLVKQVEILHGRLSVDAEGEEAQLEFSASLRDWGGEPTGTLSATARRLDAATFRAVLGEVGAAAGQDAKRTGPELGISADSLEMIVHLKQEPERLHIEAKARGGKLHIDDRTIEIHQPCLEAEAIRDPARNVVRVTAHPRAAEIESAMAEVELDGETYAVRSGRLELGGIEIGKLLDSVERPVADPTLDGTVDLSVRTDDGRSFDYEVKAKLDRLILSPANDARVEAEDGTLVSSGTWRPHPPPDGDPPIDYDIEVSFRKVEMRAGDLELSSSDSKLTMSGELEPDHRGRLRARLELPQGGGNLHGTTVPRKLFPVELAIDGILSFGEAPSLEGESRLFSPATGELVARGLTEFDQAVPRVNWQLEWTRPPDLDTLRSLAAEIGLTLPRALKIEGRHRASATLQGRLADPAVRGHLAVDRLGLTLDLDTGTREGGLWMLDNGIGGARFSRNAGDGGRVALEELEIRGDLRHGPHPDAADSGHTWKNELVLTARGRFDPLEVAAEIDGARIELQQLADVGLQGRLRPDSSVTATAKLENVDLPRLRGLSHLWIDDPAPDFVMKGKIGATIEAGRTPDGTWLVDGELDFTNAGFNSDDGARVLEGAETHWKLHASRLPDGAIDGEATGDLIGPVLLWGTLFGDFSSLSSEVRIRARRRGARWESSLVWNLPQEVRIDAHLDVEPGRGQSAGNAAHRVDYALKVDIPDLNPFLVHYIRTPFQGSVERIDSLDAAGRLRLEVGGVIDPDQRTVEGSIGMDGASFSGGDGETRIGLLDLTLPIGLEWHAGEDGAPRPAEGAKSTGSLRLEQLRLSGIDFPPVDTRLVVKGDTIRLDQPLELQVLGGRLELEQVALAEWSRPTRHLGFAVRLEDLSLSALADSLGIFPLEGALSGFFPTVRLTENRLSVDGGGKIELFGGDVEVFDISGREILTRFPRFEFSARFNNIHLLDVTRTFDFGEVYGVVEGEIRDCELFRSVPVRCEADLHSVKTKGVPRKISVKAIRNISILGSGSQVGFLDRGLQKFLDTYTYSSVGVQMQLRDDRFLLRGTEHRGDRELFVKGRLPFRIDIVNVAPGQTVSFRTMLHRLQNLEVTTTPNEQRRDAP